MAIKHSGVTSGQMEAILNKIHNAGGENAIPRFLAGEFIVVERTSIPTVKPTAELLARHTAGVIFLYMRKMRWKGLEGRVDAEQEGTLMVLLVHIYLAHLSARFLTKKDAMAAIRAQTPTTARKYFELAEGLGLIKLVPAPSDRRLTYLAPTDAGLALIGKELGNAAAELASPHAPE